MNFLLGQGLVQAATLMVGIVIVHLLPVEEYALYTIAGALLVVVSLGSNFGLSQGIVSLGSPARGDQRQVGRLLVAAQQWSRQLMVIAVLFTVALAVVLLRDGPWTLSAKVGAVVVVLGAGYAQVSSALGRAVLNLQHDGNSIFLATMAEALTRLSFLAICLVWPVAVIALLGNLVGAFVASRITLRRCGKWCEESDVSVTEERSRLRSFVLPIAPVVIYTLVQGQVAVFLLGAFGTTRAIAEYGALTRLGQVFLVLMMLNTFLVQPVFARVRYRRDFVKKLMILGTGLFAVSAAVLATSLQWPHLWLLIVGAKYSHLAAELPLALASSLVTLVGAALYVVVIARGWTQWQSIAIVPCIGAQFGFIALNRVETAADALMVNLVPALVYTLFQAFLLGFVVRRWDVIPSGSGASARPM